MEELRHLLEAKADPDKAVQMSAYMKGLFSFYGISAPIRKALFRDYWIALDDKSIDSIFSMTSACWLQPEREWQYIGTDFLRKVEKRLTWEHLPLVERLITQKSWWDTVDFLASHPLAHILAKYPEKIHMTIDRYLSSENLWLQRSALIFQLFYKEKTDFDLMKVCILELTDKNEFFLNKGAGWALRQYSKTNPSAVKEFLDLHPELPGLTIREGSKYI